MENTRNYSTWRIISGGDNHFEWELTKSEERNARISFLQERESRLPSMSDILIQGSLHHFSRNRESDGFPMIRSGTGKSVSVKEASVQKAISVLAEGELMGSSIPQHEDGRNCSSLFKTGLGKSVRLKQSPFQEAKSILGEDIVEKGNLYNPDEYWGNNLCGSFFQTGSGKKVTVSSEGIIRAKALLGLEETSDLNNSYDCERIMENQHFDTSDFNITGNLQHAKPSFAMKTKMDKIEDADVGFDTKSMLSDQYDAQQLEYIPKKELDKVGHGSFSKEHPIKFETAGGKSILISKNALERARDLLGKPEFENSPNRKDTCRETVSVDDVDSSNGTDVFHSLNTLQNYSTDIFIPGIVLPSTHVSSKTQPSLGIEESEMKSDDANFSISRFSSRPNPGNFCKERSLTAFPNVHLAMRNSSENIHSSKSIKQLRLPREPLMEISNQINLHHTIEKDVATKSRPGRKSSISPFKMPRLSRFSFPLEATISSTSNGSTLISTVRKVSVKPKVSTHYPFSAERKTAKEFFGSPPNLFDLPDSLPDFIKYINADSAQKYIFHTSSNGGIGIEEFQRMLFESGASLLHVTKEWIGNHYKWIVWKLACLERGFPTQAAGRYLTVANVLEELKYRYEREVNYGHRSCLKHILEGDAPSTAMIVLCISAIHSYSISSFKRKRPKDLFQDTKNPNSSEDEGSNPAKIELTDGWYSIKALLDVPLSKLLAAGKLFVGQKLRIWGADLCGWDGPTSPLEALTVSLVLHINGTYRAHWADKLGFCKNIGAPLDFRCVKAGGGPIPRTLVGVVRVYPILYRERFKNGSSAVRTERMENKMQQLYDHRCSVIAEGVICETESRTLDSYVNDDKGIGAKIFGVLETASEPELLMAEMSSEELNSFVTFKANGEAMKQLDIQKKIEKALEDEGFGKRSVTPLMRVRVIGLISKQSKRKGCPRKGLITIWNPTQSQVDLVEGKLYSVSGLVPLDSKTDTIYLHSRGSTAVWEPLPTSAAEHFMPFFTPRKALPLMNLDEVPLLSEFDTAAIVLHVGEVYTAGNQRKQWVFVTDGSQVLSKQQLEDISEHLLAICFFSPVTDNDSDPPVNCNLSGSVVGFCNLIKQPRDQLNNLWVAYATENTIHFLCHNLDYYSHLREAIVSVREWANISSCSIQKLRKRILCIVDVPGK